MYKKVRIRMRLGTNGFTGRSFPGQDYLTKAENVIYEDQLIRTIDGVGKYDEGQVSGAPTGYGAMDWIISDRQRIVSAWSNGKVYLEKSKNIDAVELYDWDRPLLGPVDIIKGGEEGVSGEKKLFFFSEEQEPFYIQGDSTESLSMTPALDWSGVFWPNGATMHDSSLTAWGNRNFPHTVYMSKITEHHVFDGAGTYALDVAPGVGDEIRACVSFVRGQLYVFKDSGIFHVDTSARFTATYLPVTTYSRTIGIAGPKAWEIVGGDLFFIDQNGMLRSLQAVDASNDLRSSNLYLANNMQGWVKTNIDRRNLKFTEMHYDEERGLLFISYNGKTSDQGTFRVVINLQDPGNPKVSFDKGRGDFFRAGFKYEESDGTKQLYYLGGNGYVYKTGLADRLADGQSYTATIRTSQEDFRFMEPILQQPMADSFKRFDSLMLSMIGTRDATVHVQPYIDGRAHGDGFDIRLSDISDNMILTTDSPFDLTDTLNTSDVEDISRVDHLERIGGRGRYLSLEISSQDEFKLLECYVNMSIQGNRGIG